MIVVWNCDKGGTYGFLSLEDYKQFAKKTEGKGRSVWDDQVFDVGNGGQTSEDNEINLQDFKIYVSDNF